MKKIIVSLIVIAVVIGGVFYFRSRAAAASVSYLYVPVTRGDIESTVSATGNMYATDSVQVGTQVSGIIDQLNATFNSRVHKGELIARLDTTVLRLAVDRAIAAEDQGSADLKQKGYALDQIKRLLATGAETESDYETALANFAMSKATLASDSVALRQVSGDAHLAADVTQMVFAALARKAGGCDVDFGRRDLRFRERPAGPREIRTNGRWPPARQL